MPGFLEETLVGRQIGPYKLLQELGRGGAARVFRARDHAHQRDVAIKRLELRWARHKRVRARFIAEGEILSSLQHPAIPKLYGQIEDGPTLALALELLHGASLERRLEDDEVIPAQVAVPWIIQLLDALQHAHERGVIHRDVKPGNLIVGPQGLKVLDFGLAKTATGPDITAEGTTVGTLYFLSREQARGEELDGRADVYSAGVTLYQCVTGALPYDCKDRGEIIQAVLSSPPIPPRQQWPIVDPALERIILCAMEKEADRRFPSAAAMRDALIRWLNGPPQSPGSAAGRVPSTL